MKKQLIITIILASVLLLSTVAAFGQQWSFVGKEAVVKEAISSYSLNSSKNAFSGGFDSWVKVTVSYLKAKANLADEDFNKIYESWSDVPSDAIETRTFYVLAFSEKDNKTPMCYDQFRVMHRRLKKAGTIRVRFLMARDGEFTPMVKARDGSDAIELYPSRIRIVRNKKDVPK